MQELRYQDSTVTGTLGNKVLKLKLAQPVLLILYQGSCLGCLNGSVRKLRTLTGERMTLIKTVELF